MGEIETLVEPHIPALRRYAWALTRDHDRADDLVQDCLERAVSRWRLRRRDGDVKAWLFTILRNLYISDWRQLRRRGVLLPIDDAASAVAGGVQPDQVLAAQDVFGALELLPEDQKSILLLIGVEDLSYEQAADVLGVPIGTVMSRLSRARERLRGLVDGGVRTPALRRVK